MKLTSLLIGLAGVATLVTPAVAQDKTAAEAALGRKVIRDYAECTVQAQRELARKYVVMADGERMSGEEFAKVNNARCLGFLKGRLKMSGQQYRAALAERLFETEHKGKAAIDPTPVAPLVWPAPRAPFTTDRGGKPLSAEAAAAQQERYNRLVAEQYLGRIGECVVRQNPSAAHALLSIRSGEAGEIDAFRTLGPSIPPCVPAGEKLSLNRAILRDAIVISYYRIAAATAAAGATQ